MELIPHGRNNHVFLSIERKRFSSQLRTSASQANKKKNECIVCFFPNSQSVVQIEISVKNNECSLCTASFQHLWVCDCCPFFIQCVYTCASRNTVQLGNASLVDVAAARESNKLQTIHLQDEWNWAASKEIYTVCFLNKRNEISALLHVKAFLWTTSILSKSKINSQRHIAAAPFYNWKC